MTSEDEEKERLNHVDHLPRFPDLKKIMVVTLSTVNCSTHFFRLAIFQSNNFSFSSLSERDERTRSNTRGKGEMSLLSSLEAKVSRVNLKAKWKKSDQCDDDDDGNASDSSIALRDH
jgi:hypothetical protein